MASPHRVWRLLQRDENREEVKRMSVYMQHPVAPPDPERFVTAVKAFRDRTVALGAKSQRLYRMESDPSQFSLREEYESHDAAHRASDEFGAGSTAEWETQVWTPVEF